MSFKCEGGPDALSLCYAPSLSVSLALARGKQRSCCSRCACKLPRLIAFSGCVHRVLSVCDSQLPALYVTRRYLLSVTSLQSKSVRKPLRNPQKAPPACRWTWCCCLR